MISYAVLQKNMGSVAVLNLMSGIGLQCYWRVPLCAVSMYAAAPDE